MTSRSFYWILLATRLMAQSPCALGGRVVDGSSGEPIEQAQVFVQTIHADATYRVVTNAGGLFCFRDLDSGSYKILVKRYGYVDVKAVDSGGRRATVVVQAAARSPELTISMSPCGTISGIVMLKSGEPPADAEVTLYGHFPPGSSVAPGDPRRTITDASGRFRFAGLEEGVYRLGVSGREDMLARDMVAGSGGEQRIDTFYPASPSTDGAQAIKLESGQAVTGLVITMQTAPFRTLAGRVVAKDFPKYVMALYHKPSGASGDYAIEVKPDGTFSRGGLPAAIYNVHIGPRFDQRVDLTRGDVIDLVIELDKPRP